MGVEIEQVGVQQQQPGRQRCLDTGGADSEAEGRVPVARHRLLAPLEAFQPGLVG